MSYPTLPLALMIGWWLWLLPAPADAAIRRVVIIKADGVPADLVEKLVHETNPASGKSRLPWINQLFYRQGARVENFYTRGISLSTPSWSLIDTGQHLQIRGNVEYDRYTFQAYDYLNFFPFYLRYALSRRVDMPAVQVLDDTGTPLLVDRFPYRERYESFQLLQRGVRWKTLEASLRLHFAGRSMRDLLDEWQVGLELSSGIARQTERELIEKLQDPNVRYLDFFTGDFDHVAHLVRDAESQRQALEELDALVGRLWLAIQKAPLASETALILVSDHGMNSDPDLYSQGYNLVEWLRGPAGGAHHVVTNRHPLSEYKLKGLDPFVSRVVTPSENHPYLRGQAEQYPTVLLDLDGNERASVHLRNNELNRLHVLLRQLARRELPNELRAPAIRAVHQIVDRNRNKWRRNLQSLHEELAAVRRSLDRLHAQVTEQPKKWLTVDRDFGRDKEARRLTARLDDWMQAERGYTEYARSIEALLAFQCERCEPSPETIAHLIPPRVMGDRNSIADLRQYVVSAVPGGLALGGNGDLDLDRSFRTIDYPAAFKDLRVRNNLQPGIGAAPVDFVALRVPREALKALAAEDQPTDDAVWLYRGESKQALLLRRTVPGQDAEIRYLPVAQFTEDPNGAMRWQARPFGAGLPLELWEDPRFKVPADARDAWLGRWHTEREWLATIHETRYSNGIIGLLEHFGPIRVATPPLPRDTSAADAELLTRWQARRRASVEPDLLVLANDHWNFNVRSFNPGGNHGSFFRASTHSVFLLSGGTIKPQQVVEAYDNLSFLPTIARILGWATDQFPGKPIPISTN